MTLTTCRSLCLTVVTLIVATQHPDAAERGTARPGATADRVPCGDVTAVGVEHQYTVTGRVKLLLIWTGRREVGQARFARSDTAAGTSRLALLVGTDPDRAPMGLNRWGYIAETTCDAETFVTGVMTESKEQSIEQARSRTDDQSQRRPLRAIRSRVSATESATETLTILPTRTVTYQDLGEVLSMEASTRAGLRIAVPPHAESGFLRAVTSLMQESAMAFGESRKPPDGLRRLYVYGGNIYEMTLRQSRPTRRAGTGELESDFQVRNRTTGSTTQFQIAYTTSGRNPAVARRIVYRPRWWLELELLLKEPS